MTKSVKTLDKKRTALIKQKLGGGGGDKWTSYFEQAREGSVDEDHFTNNQGGSLLQIANQKYARNVKRTVKTSDTSLLFIKLFTISIFDVLIDCEFPMTH